jgi:hypothetical protein
MKTLLYLIALCALLGACATTDGDMTLASASLCDWTSVPCSAEGPD